MSLERFEPGLVSGGLLVYNADVVTRPVRRDDVTALAVHASAEAQALGNSRLMNVVTLGVWAAVKGDVLDRGALVEGLRHMAKHPKLFELNGRALDRGLALARELREREAALAPR